MKLSGIHYAIIAFVLVTAAMHLGTAFDPVFYPPQARSDPLFALFALNGLGYLGLGVAYFAPIGLLQRYHNVVRWVLIAYIVATIISWFVVWLIPYVIIQGEPFFQRDAIYGVPSKLAEIGLLILLPRDRATQARPG